MVLPTAFDLSWSYVSTTLPKIEFSFGTTANGTTGESASTTPGEDSELVACVAIEDPVHAPAMESLASYVTDVENLL